MDLDDAGGSELPVVGRSVNKATERTKHMIAHDVSEMEQFESCTGCSDSGEFDDLLSLAKAAPEEIHLFPIRIGHPDNSILAAVARERASQSGIDAQVGSTVISERGMLSFGWVSGTC